MNSHAASSSPLQRISLLACSALILLFGVVSYSAVRTKSATYDEPLHLLSGWLAIHQHDFRLDLEHPPLAKYWAALPISGDAVLFNPADPAWSALAQDVHREWDVAIDTLYRTPVNDPLSLLSRGRMMMTLLGMLLGVVVALWAWRLSGPIAAVIACALYSLDPNFLGHAPLVGNDVPMALMFTAGLYVAWRCGQMISPLNAALLAVMIATAILTKNSGILLLPLLAALLVLRALLPGAWLALGRELTRRRHKLIAAAALMLWVGVVAWAGLWAAYQFRFSASPDTTFMLNKSVRVHDLAFYRFEAIHPHPRPAPFDPQTPIDQLTATVAGHLKPLDPGIERCKALLTSRPDLSDDLRSRLTSTIDSAASFRSEAAKFLESVAAPATAPASSRSQSELRNTLFGADAFAQNTLYQMQFLEYWSQLPHGGADRFARSIFFLLDHELLPESYLHGVLVLYALSMARSTFFLGQLSDVGTWYYFPLAIHFKWPIATQIAILLAGILAFYLLVRRWREWQGFAWSSACVALPVTAYLAPAIGSNLNIGIRYVLPVFPLLYVAAGVIGCLAWRHWPKTSRVVATLLAMMLAIETLSAWPNYIAYFNIRAGGSRGGVRLLGDSNLDWGQDLPLLAQWEKNHPDAQIALCYFGTAEPGAYSVQSISLPPWPPPAEVVDNFVMAISATHLQGIHTSSFIGYQNLTPSEVLGGTIYLYDLRVKR